MKKPTLEGEYEQTPFVIENENFGWESEQLLFLQKLFKNFSESTFILLK